MAKAPASKEEIVEALRESEERYRTLFEQAPVGVFLYDMDLRIFALNARFADILQSTVDKVRGLDMTRLRDTTVVPFIRAALSGEPTNYEGTYSATTSSAKIIVSMRLAPLRDGKGVIVGGMGVVEDITERRRAETTLRQLERRRAWHMQRTPLAMIDFNAKGEIVEWNEAAESMFGFTHDEVVGRGPREIIVPEENLSLTTRTWYDLLANRGGERLVQENLTKDGRRIHCDWHNTALFDEDGTVIGVASLVQDITESRAAEHALKSSEARFRALIERSPDAVLVLRHFTIAFANPSFVQLLAYSDAADLIGGTIFDLVSAEDHDTLRRRVAELETGAVIPPQEYRLIRLDRAVVLVEVVSLYLEYDGAPAIVCLARDVTERKLMQARLLQADRMVSVGTLAAGVAHEINNPLAYLMANLDVVARRKLPQVVELVRELEARIEPLALEGHVGTELPERLAMMGEMLGIAREGAERVRNIVRDLKTFSRADDDRSGPVDVRLVMDASINMAWNEIRHRATLEKTYDDVPLVEANESRLGQVFLNLLVNAAQALPVGTAAEHRILVRTRTDANGRAIVEVSDTGPGIAPSIAGRIFDPFFTTKPIGVGTGLGLWICQGIVVAIGGEIGVLNEPGRGATFRVALPARSVSTPLRAARVAARPLPSRGRILVVDDEAALATAIRSELGAEHEVVTVRSGREALELLRNDEAFDVILCDLLMPDVTGMDVYEQVAKEKPWLKRRFAFMTGGAFTGRARDFLDGIDNVTLEKPFEMDRVRSLFRPT